MSLPDRPLPPPLKGGDRVQLVAASSALADRERLDAGLAVLRSWGLEVIEADGAERRYRPAPGPWWDSPLWHQRSGKGLR